MTDFNELDIKTASEILAEFMPEGHDENKAFYVGDHWQGANAWIGPRPTGVDSTTVLSQIQAAFISRNAIKEVVDRHVNGIMGRRPNWALVVRRPLKDGEVPSPQELDLISEAQHLLGQWLDRQLRPSSEDDAATDPVRSCLTIAMLDSRCTLRLFVPPDEVENGQVSTAPIEESIFRTHLQALSVENAGVQVDPYSRKRCGIYAYVDADEKDATELTYLDEEGNTIIKVMGEDSSQETMLPLGGLLTMHEVRRPMLVQAPVRSQQKLLNLALTMLARNVVQGGFLERVLLNAQLPGQFTEENGIRRFVPEPIKAGAGTLNALVGVETNNPDGSKSLASPDVRWKDPVPVDTFVQTEAKAYQSILSEVHQLHYLISGDASASGVSRVQAMADFVIDLAMTKMAVDRAWSWMLETVLAMTAVFSGSAERYAELRVVSDAKIDAGPMTPEERKSVIEIVNNKLASKETGMSMIGIDDPKSEQDRIDQESEKESQNLAGALLNAAETNFNRGPSLPADDEPQGDDDEQDV